MNSAARTAVLLARPLAVGVLGTTAMTLGTALEERMRPGVEGPVDYDASDHVATAVGSVLRRPPRTGRERRAYFLLAHWGYGSAVALAYPMVRGRVGHDVAAGAVFFLGCQAMAMTLFPTLGGTPPPHRWRRSIVLSSLAQHALYAAVVTTATRALERPVGGPVGGPVAQGRGGYRRT